MEKLNQVEHLARVNARKWCSVTTVDTRDILAIAEAFRELEHRAEAAEKGFQENEKAKQELFIVRDSLLTANLNAGKRIKELEAKLAELEKPQLLKCSTHTRPVPAVSLAELVPDGWKLVPAEPNWEMISAAIKSHEGDAFLPVSLYKSMLAASPERVILRNIEEEK